MAKRVLYSAGLFRLEHTCGHTESHDLGGSNDSVTRQVYRLEHLPCSDCEAAAQVAPVAALVEVVAELVAAAPVVTTTTMAELEAAMTEWGIAEEVMNKATYDSAGHMQRTLALSNPSMGLPVPTLAEVEAWWVGR